MVPSRSLPLPTLSRQKARPAIHRKTEKERQLAEGEGVGKEPIHTMRESLVLFQSFNTIYPVTRKGRGLYRIISPCMHYMLVHCASFQMVVTILPIFVGFTCRTKGTGMEWNGMEWNKGTAQVVLCKSRVYVQ
jgi:hypothetical protein